MRRTAIECAFQNIQVKPGQKLTPLHRQLLRVMERREKYRTQAHRGR